MSELTHDGAVAKLAAITGVEEASHPRAPVPRVARRWTVSGGERVPETLADVLAAHRFRTRGRRGGMCFCGEVFPYSEPPLDVTKPWTSEQRHVAHVAATLRPLIDAEVRDGVQAALYATHARINAEASTVGEALNIILSDARKAQSP